MEQYTFTKDDMVKVCHCNEGVREALISQGWTEKKKKGRPFTKVVETESEE